VIIEQVNATPESAGAMTTDELAHCNAAEFERYRNGCRNIHSNTACGLELFRRAIVRRDEVAWSTVYTQYRGLVQRWVAPAADAEDDLVAMTFARFWRAVDAEAFDRFASLAALLQYLKLCAQTARLDWRRAIARQAPAEPLVAILPTLAAHVETGDAPVVAGEIWHMVQRCVIDTRERDVLYLSYVKGLRPREICAHDRIQFPTVEEVYRLKRMALDRLRRQPEVQALRR
jgi:DNA-directed RNA polymerase specialized sigma24 family protein